MFWKNIQFATLMLLFQSPVLIFLPRNIESSLRKKLVIGIVVILGLPFVLPNAFPYCLIASGIFSLIIGIWKRGKVFTVYGSLLLLAISFFLFYTTFVLPPDA